MPVKALMVEQIVRRINGGNPSGARRFKDEDIAMAIGQEINTKLRADYVTTTLSGGETIPEGTTLMTYTGTTALTVVKYGLCNSMCVLPIRPIKLPRDLGLNHVSRDGDHGNPFIPTQQGQAAFYQKMPVINKLLGQIGYMQEGNKVLFDQDLTAININKVMVKLMVVDIFSLGDFDELPITPEMEADIVDILFRKFANSPPQDKVDDPSTVKQ